MLKCLYYSLCVFLFWMFLSGCSGNQQPLGEQLAKTYCSSCHLFPDPSLLDKQTWTNNILPVMGKNLGIKYFHGKPYPDIQITRDNNKVTEQLKSISLDDWNNIVTYYQTSAPDTLPGLPRPQVTKATNIFTTKQVLIDKGFPSATYVKIDTANKWMYASNATDSSIAIYDNKLGKISETDVHGVIVDMQFDSSITKPGERGGNYTNIGYINPNEGRTGNAYRFTISKQGMFNRNNKIADSMPRPVQVTQCDLDKDGKPDYLVCGFGNKAGEFYWMRNNGNGTFDKRMLWAIPGAIKAYVQDFNGDGLPDIMVLFAQAQEGIYLFTNKGSGNFERKDLLRFPPVYGSSYFELDDFNNDGFKDILYTCGDNADYSAKELKPYHGLYIFLNDGKNNFKQAYFFPMYGCYKAIARDFEKSGRLDIAAISFFPDKKNHAQESIIYLHNNGGLQFTPYTLPNATTGNWITMDAGDIDGDGDDDLIIGNLDMKEIRRDSKTQQLNKPAFMLLQNNTKRP